MSLSLLVEERQCSLERNTTLGKLSVFRSQTVLLAVLPLINCEKPGNPRLSKEFHHGLCDFFRIFLRYDVEGFCKVARRSFS